MPTLLRFALADTISIVKTLKEGIVKAWHAIPASREFMKKTERSNASRQISRKV